MNFCGRTPTRTLRDERVHAYLPFGVVVLLQGTGVCPREDDQAAVLSVHLLHRSPSADNLVNRPEREVVQILVHRVTRRFLTYDEAIRERSEGIKTLEFTSVCQVMKYSGDHSC